MASAATSLPILRGTHPQCSNNEKPFFFGHPRSGRTNLILSRPSFPSFAVAFARRRHTAPNSTSVPPKRQKKKQNPHRNGAQEDEDLDEDAFEALFRQLEEDLKNDDLSVDGFNDDDITEEDLAKLEKELEEALKDDELLGALGSIEDGKTEDETEDEEEEEEEGDDNLRNAYENHNLEEEDVEDEEIPVQLKNWQLKRLAYALKAGRRKTNIKNLASDLCLDRAVVLQLLRNPPPKLLMMSAALPDKPVSTVVEPVKEPPETISLEATAATQKPEANTKIPVHVMQSNWSAQKRIKKVHLETLERVYRRTKRPTNAMISSIVHVTNLPRRRVLKWFEDRRAEDGVPERRLPYQRSSPTYT